MQLEMRSAENGWVGVGGGGGGGVCVGCLMSQQHPSVFQGRICSDNFTCCHTEMEVAYQTFYLTQSQYTDTSPSTDPITPGAWQGSHWSASFFSHWYDLTWAVGEGGRMSQAIMLTTVFG